MDSSNQSEIEVPTISLSLTGENELQLKSWPHHF